MSTLSKTYSWVIVRTATGEPIMETYNHRIIRKLNREKYHAIPIYDWLAGFANQNPAFQKSE